MKGLIKKSKDPPQPITIIVKVSGVKNRVVRSNCITDIFFDKADGLEAQLPDNKTIAEKRKTLIACGEDETTVGQYFIRPNNGYNADVAGIMSMMEKYACQIQEKTGSDISLDYKEHK